ncbi:MAG: hypothetical protein GY724_26755 [Actinomycetia bacterium]|nr:hypothetical protein [Actinomycetes bacterium]
MSARNGSPEDGVTQSAAGWGSPLAQLGTDVAPLCRVLGAGHDERADSATQRAKEITAP